MLEKSSIIKFLRENREFLHTKYGVVDIGLIGSYARDEQTYDSDIDFLVVFTEPKFDFLAGLTIFLEKKFEKKVDVVIKGKYLKKTFLDIAEQEIIYA